MPSRIAFLTALALVAASSAAQAPALQTLVVDYDDGALASPPALGFPFYTPGGGSAGQTVRVQFHCPPGFGALPTTPMLCTRVGVQLAGQATYGTFRIRAGSSPVTALTNVWAQNLPDQRLQHELDGAPLDFGPNADWVEWDLAHPFVFQPGQGVVLDLTTNLASIGSFLGTAVTTAPTPRLLDLDYQGLPVGPAPRTSGGLKFRMVFEPLGSLSGYGAGCAGQGGFVPEIGANGVAAVGSAGFAIELSSAAPGTLTGLLLGTARGVGAPFSLPRSFGGGCALLHSADLPAGSVVTTGGAAGSGTANLPLPVPNDPGLVGAVLFAQWAQIDPASSSPLGITFSDAGVVAIR